MKTFQFFIRLCVAGFFVTFLFACIHKPDYRSFIVKVDSIQVPNSIYANTPFEIKFFGIIGANGCYSFSNFNIQLSSNNMQIEAWGKVDTKTTICPTVMVYLTGHNLVYTVPSTGIFNIKIKQPDNSFIEKQITVN